MDKLTLFGYAKTTKALAKRFGPATFFDDKITVPHKDDEGNLLLPPTLFDPQKSKIEIPSPGFPPNHPLIKKSKNLISEYDLFLSNIVNSDIQHPKYTIWISGTNGKTTTTQMVTHLLRDRGAVNGGNIGVPLAEMDEESPIWVLETSSFTLHYTKYAKPDLYLLLPVTPDHLAWHGSQENYISDKLYPLEKMFEGEAVILPKEFANRYTNGFKIPYRTHIDAANYFGIDTKRVNFEGAFLLDAVLALGVSKILFDEIDYDKINSFKLDPHRQEKIVDSQGRLWVNDSKATNIDATIQALVPFKDKKIYLILGGDDKGVDLTPLFCALNSYNVTIFAIGKNSEKIADLSNKYNIECNIEKTIDNAVTTINRLLDKNSVALLSPAAASLDQFSSYVERGNIFKKLIRSF